MATYLEQSSPESLHCTLAVRETCELGDLQKLFPENRAGNKPTKLALGYAGQSGETNVPFMESELGKAGKIPEEIIPEKFPTMVKGINQLLSPTE